MNDSFKNLKDIVDREHQTFAEAIKVNSNYLEFAYEAIDLLWCFIKEFKIPNNLGFALFLGQFQKALTQTLISILRSHSIQGFLTLRYALESSVLCFYSLEVTDIESFYTWDELDRASPNRKVLNKANKWLKTTDSEFSEFIETRKKLINNYFAHSNILPSANNLEINGNEIKTNFFDKKDDGLDDHIMGVIGDIAFSFMAMAERLNSSYKIFELIDNFHPSMIMLQNKLNLLRQETLSQSKFSKWVDIPEFL